jgi:hypothetical protein
VIPAKMWRPARRRAVALAIGLAVQGGLAGGFLGSRLGEVLGTSTARAFDAATTHAGLTQRAAVASHLHHILSRRLARPLGLFDPIALHPELMPVEQRRLLMSRLFALDPAGGYRPGPDAVASALAWTVAGTVIAKTPPERMRNFFFDPSTGAGLRDDAAVEASLHAVRQVVDRGNLRDVMTGASFAFEGEPSVKWLEEPENDVGLRAFRDELERAVVDPDPAARSSALARALLALGGSLALLEDAGNPAAVRNDFRGSYLRGSTAAPFDRRSPFEHAVAELYGSSGVPAPTTVTTRANVRAFFTAPDGQGLADRTQRRFFSDGTLPEDGIVERDTSTADVVRAARDSLTYALPTVPRLELHELGAPRYVTVSDAPGARPRRLLGYVRVPGRVRFFLDAAIYADSARALLPEIASYAAGFADHLLRGAIELVVDGGQVRATASGPAGKIRGGTLRIFAEDAAGRRREIGAVASQGPGIDSASAVLPPGTRRAAAVLRGEDNAGPVVAFGELIVTSRR